MKINKIIIVSAVLLAACTSTKKSAETAKANESAAPVATLSTDLAKAAEKRYPGVAHADIAEGQKLYTGKCGKCHGLPAVDARTEEKWPGTVDWMAPKAHLDDAQKDKVLKYVLCARDLIVKK